MNKGLKVILVIVLVLVVFGALGGSAYFYSSKQLDDSKEANTETLMYFIGDSIAEGVLGPSPISERMNYAYFGVQGQRNGFTYYNRAISGAQSGGLIEFLERDADSGVNMEVSLLKSADIIQLSILGNDFLQDRLDDLFFDIASEDYTRIDSIVASSTIKFKRIIELIKEKSKPEAALFVQTVYNPYFEGSQIIIPELKERLAAINVTSVAQFRHLANQLIEKLNSIVYDYAKSNPGSYTIIDVYKGMREYYDNNIEEDPTIGSKLIMHDGVHPSNFGHAMIADLSQRALEEAGLIKDPKYSLKKYKDLRVSQLTRLFRGTKLNLGNIMTKISEADTYEQVTEIYFKSVDGVIPIYDVSRK